MPVPAAPSSDPSAAPRVPGQARARPQEQKVADSPAISSLVSRSETCQAA